MCFLCFQAPSSFFLPSLLMQTQDPNMQATSSTTNGGVFHCFQQRWVIHADEEDWLGPC